MNSAPHPLAHFKLDERQPVPAPSEAESTALYRLLFTGKATKEESRMAVRYLLRQASKSLERRA